LQWIQAQLCKNVWMVGLKQWGVPVLISGVSLPGCKWDSPDANATSFQRFGRCLGDSDKYQD
jgi:hypothetical protein